MEIFINKKPANITLDTEKTLGDILSGIEQWISPTGHRIKSLSMDGNNLAAGDLAQVFNKDISEIVRLDIGISSYRELSAEALEDLTATCLLFAGASFEERSGIAEIWGNSPAANFLLSDMPDIFQLAANSFAGNGISAQDLMILLDERLREIEDPEREISNSETLIKKISQRMQELPLDMQTGKDASAAETIQLFSRMGEKLFRILFIFKSEGLIIGGFTIDNMPALNFLEEFKNALVEISGAYRDQDTVLAGDIAEYELSPRILRFFEALKSIKISDIQLLP